MSGFCCQAGGTNRRMARNKSMPPFTNNSSILSSELESEPVSFTNGAAVAKSGISGVRYL